MADRAPGAPLSESGGRCAPGASAGARLAGLCRAHRRLEPDACVAAARRDCAALALSLDPASARALQAAILALSELAASHTRGPPTAPGPGLAHLARTSGLPVDQWLAAPGGEADHAALARFLHVYVLRAGLPERMDDVQWLGPRAAAARWAEQGDDSRRTRDDHSLRVATEDSERVGARLLERACELALAAFARSPDGQGPPPWPLVPWRSVALASDAAGWDRLAGQPPPFWADLRLGGLPLDTLAAVVHRAAQLQRHAGVTCVPPTARRALSEARGRLTAAMEAGAWPLAPAAPAAPPAQAAPAQAGPAAPVAQATQAAPAQAAPAQAAPAQVDPVAPAQAAPAQSAPAQSAPAQSAPAQSALAQAAPAQAARPRRPRPRRPRPRRPRPRRPRPRRPRPRRPWPRRPRPRRPRPRWTQWPRPRRPQRPRPRSRPRPGPPLPRPVPTRARRPRAPRPSGACGSWGGLAPACGGGSGPRGRGSSRPPGEPSDPRSVKAADCVAHVAGGQERALPTMTTRVSTALGALYAARPSPAGVPVRDYAAVVRAIGALAETLPIVTALALADVTGNLQSLQRCALRSRWHQPTLEQLCDAELQGAEWRRLLHPRGVDGSACTSLLWTQRAMRFVTRVLHAVIVERCSVAAALTAAYGSTLRRHHGFVLRSAFAVAVRAAPSRAAFLSSVAEASSDETLLSLLDEAGAFFDAIDGLLVGAGLEAPQP